MSTVMRENEWAADMVSKHTLGKKPAETLRRVARYFMDECNLDKNATRARLELFLLQCDSTASVIKWSDTLDRSVKYASKYPAINILSIPVYDKEIQKIRLLNGKQVQRLAFTLLCLAKYWNLVTGKDGWWVNSKDSEIMEMANVRTSLKRQSAMYSMLCQQEMIRFSKKVDNTNVQVCFAETGEVAMWITDLRNLGYQYLMYLGEPYFVCQCCGITTKQNDKNDRRRQKYCPECAAATKMRQTIESVMRCRSRTNQNVRN